MLTAERRRLAIIGAGLSGLLACKYAVEGGFSPVVFEAEEAIGGVWNHTLQSTKLQIAKESYAFSDFPWPSSLRQVQYPSHDQVLDYIKSYAQHYALFPYIKFNSKVVSLDYVGESYEEMEAWDLWSRTGKPFESKGKWHVLVENIKTSSTEMNQFDFVILCVGQFSEVPNIPEFPPNQGPEVFNGTVLHSIDYSSMNDEMVVGLVRRKRITVIGSMKSAMDIAAECAEKNGVEYPCTMIQRTVHWVLPAGTQHFWGVNLGYLYFTRFSELLVNKPGETFLLSILATLLAPLRWAFSKFAESYLRWKFPLKKHGMIPNNSFLQDVSSCQIAMLPEKFYEMVDQGSIILKKSQSFGFCKEGLIIDGETQPLQTDVVILATGFDGEKKLKDMFKSHIFQKHFVGPPTAPICLYRQVIHPRIPQLAIIGYGEGFSNLLASELRSQWLTHFLRGNLQLPSIRNMEKDVKMWKDNMKIYGGKYFWNSCVAAINIWYNDQLCKDMGLKHKRKKGVVAELFQPYGPADYAGLTCDLN